MKFPYQPFDLPGVGRTIRTTVYRPIVPVRILGPRGEVSTVGLLDTGSDDTLLPVHLLDYLGMITPTGPSESIRGLGGGTVLADFATVDLELSKGKTTYRWSARVGFYGGIRAILGHSGVLEHFLATFNHRQRYATLQPNGPLPPPAMLAP